MDPPARSPLVDVPGIEGLVEIGHGGAGVVYRGHQGELGRDVAVKVVWSRAAGEADLARWRREVSAMARLSNHPNIVAVHDGGTTADGVPYLVMPYVPGGSLGDRLRAAGPLPPRDVAAVGIKLAGALAAAHDAGVLHRDVKPDNVLLSQYGEPQLADFGIARLADSTMTRTGTVHATVAYAAPEVLAGRHASPASDVYGLGATLHACLTGAAPFAARAGETLVALAVRIGTEPPPDLAAAGVPSRLARVVADAMAKDPAQRIATADELARRLAAATEAPAAAPRARTGRWRSRLLAGVGLAAIAALAAVVTLALLVGDNDPAGPARATATTAAPSTTAAPGPSPPAPPPAGRELEEAARTYLDALDAGDLRGAYAMTTAGFREVQPYEGYAEFWGGFDRVRVQGRLEVDPGELTVAVPLRLDGAREAYTLRFARADDGTLLVDGPRPG